MKNYKYLTFSFLIIILGAFFYFLNFSCVQAKVDSPVPQNIIKTQIKYPIPELENCQDKNICKQYCSVASHYLACTNFGEKNNLISKEEAGRAKKLVDALKSLGPGGCKGEIACKNYCNETGNQKECFKFSMKNGLISAEKLKEIENGMVQLRSGLKQLPPEMKNCVIKKVGADVINKIESGKGKAIDMIEIGGVMQNCATSFMGTLQQNAGIGLSNAPPEVQSCFKSIMSGIGDKIKGGGLVGQSDITSVIFQNCLPKGTNIPSGAGGGINMEALKKMQQFYGKNLSPKNLEQIKKLQEQGQYDNIAPPEIHGNNSGMGL